MMKKVKGLVSFLLVSILFMSTVFSSSVFANNGISVEIGGQRVNFLDQQPMIIDNRTFVPVRGVFEQLGYNVSWDQSTQTATLSNGVNIVIIAVGKPTFTTNGKVYSLDVPAQIINGRTLLPFRAVLESVDYSVEWDSERNTVMIFTVSSTQTVAEASAFMVGYWGLIEDQSYFHFMPSGEYTFWYFGTLSDGLEEDNGSWWVEENTYNEDAPYLLMISDNTGRGGEPAAIGSLDYSPSGWEFIQTRYTRVSNLPDIITSKSEPAPTPKPTDTSSSTKNYPGTDVPDFGELYGIELSSSEDEGYAISYTYIAFSGFGFSVPSYSSHFSEFDIRDYKRELQDRGWTLTQGSYVSGGGTFEKDGSVVTIGYSRSSASDILIISVSK